MTTVERVLATIRRVLGEPSGVDRGERFDDVWEPFLVETDGYGTTG